MGWYMPDFLVGVWCTSKNKFGGDNYYYEIIT